MMRWLAIFLKGFAIGVVELIPGISGGTIALITGIYSRLLKAILRFDVRWIQLIVGALAGKNPIRQATGHIDAAFLACLLFGMGIALFSLSGLIRHLLETQTILINACFFGLIGGAGYTLIKQTGALTKDGLLVMAIGLIIGLSLLQLPVLGSTKPAIWLTILAGCAASCAWILPGISGSFILLSIGLYQHFITALSEGQMIFLSYFALGVALGLPVFSRILAGFLHQHQK